MRLIPRDEQFFDMFNQIADRLVRSTGLLNQMFAEPAQLEQHAAAIKVLEHEADNLTRDTIERIDKVFVTPFDREDIHMLASRLDDTVDLIDGTARRAVSFRVREVREPAVRLAEVLSRAAARVQNAVKEIQTPATVSAQTQELNRLEEEGDAIYESALAELFSGAYEPLEVMKWKELYDKLEDAIDQCEDVGDVLQSISLKNS